VVVWRAGGRQHKKVVRGTERQAERFLTLALAARERGERREPDHETFADHAARWLVYKRSRVEPSTYNDYEAHVRLRLVPVFGAKRLRAIDRAAIEAYLDQLDVAGVLSRKTINDSLIPLRQILARAVQAGGVATNPARSDNPDEPLELPYDQPEMRRLDRDQAQRYLDACSERFRPLAELLIGTGARIGEALALEWADLRLDTLEVTIARSAQRTGIGSTKTDRRRTIQIDPHLASVLREHRRASGRVGGLVFPNEVGGVWDRDNIRRREHGPALKRAGLSEEVRLHDLRHTFGSLAADAGASSIYIQTQMGHREARTTARYLHPDRLAHREEAARVAAWWRTQSG
jgi:integrase